MGDIKLFQVSDSDVRELESHSVSVEKSLQAFIEKQLEPLLGVRFLASEYSTGKTHGGRIDTLGIDENGCPVIIEYKRALNENVINQGLFYLDWLMDHRGDFELLVLKRFGEKTPKRLNGAIRDYYVSLGISLNMMSMLCNKSAAILSLFAIVDLAKLFFSLNSSMPRQDLAKESWIALKKELEVR